ALLLLPVRLWAVVLVALLPIHLVLRNPATGFDIALLYYAANALGALASASVMRWQRSRRASFDGFRHVAALLGAGLATGPVVSAVFGTLSIALRGLTVSLWDTWKIWALADCVGVLVVVPAVLAAPELWRLLSRSTWRRTLEGTAVGLAIFATTVPTLGVADPAHGLSFVFLYVPFPLLIWAARRFGPVGAAIANLELVCIIIASVAFRRGPFGLPWDAETVIAVQQFLLLTAGTSLLLAASVAEKGQFLAALQESDTRYRYLIDAASDIIAFVKPDGTILQLNHAFERTTGWRRAQWIGRSVFELLTPSDAGAALREFQAILTNGPEGRPTRWTFPSASGSPRIAEVLATVFMVDGRPERIMFIARDVTDKERAAEQRAREAAERQTTDKMQAIGHLAGGIAHDFNNMLHAVRGYTEIARGTTPSDHPARRALGELDQVTDRAAALARQLLAFSRSEPVRSEVLSLDTVVHEFVDILRRVLGAHVPITVAAARDGSTVRADRNEIGQVLMNLSINARDAMPDGGPLLVETGSIELTEEDLAGQPDRRPGRWAFLRVTDRGQGIPDDVRPHIFEPFFTTKATGQGTGLGLATVYAIAQRHGGFISVQTAPGTGTSLTVHFPAIDVPADPRAASTPSEQPRGGAGETILVAEDEDAVRELATELLEDAGYRVIAAEDGRAAEALVRDSSVHFDIALLDVVMPHRHGRDVFEAIQDVRPGLPVIFSTGYSFGELADLPAPDLVTTLM